MTMGDNGEHVEGEQPSVEIGPDRLPMIERRLFIQPVTPDPTGPSRKIFEYTDVESGVTVYAGVGNVQVRNPANPSQAAGGEVQFPIPIPEEVVDEALREAGDDVVKVGAAVLRYAFTHMDEAFAKVRPAMEEGLTRQAFGGGIIVPGPGGRPNKFRRQAGDVLAQRRKQMGL